ncbi:MAG: glycyl-radical enzyme activating protein [Candidatus Krumholzibacteriota bacterium]|nr:glycyl-radical enzyme activating protein [Candidatus Krumholzibacteriota bacterium]
MKGSIFDLKKFAIHDGPGIRTTVFFSGCPLRCWWCHNPESFIDDRQRRPGEVVSRISLCRYEGSERVTGNDVPVEAVIREIMKDEVFYRHSGGGVTISGGEPLFQPDFLVELLKACGDEEIHIALDTSGYAERKDIERLGGLVDLYLFDIKFIDEKEHIKYTGVSNRLILDNLQYLESSGADIEIRIPLIPGITDTARNIEDIISFLMNRDALHKVSLLPYNKMCEDKFRRMRMKYRPGPVSPHSPQDIAEITEKFTSAGLEVGIGG